MENHKSTCMVVTYKDYIDCETPKQLKVSANTKCNGGGGQISYINMKESNNKVA